MPKRSKRSPRSSSSSQPRPKQARQEHLQHDRRSPPLQPADAPLEYWLLQDLEGLLNDKNRAENQLLQPIYWTVTEHIRLRGGEFRVADLADEDHFKTTAKQQGLKYFFDLLRKAVDTGKKDDRMAMFNYSMCFYYEVNLVMNKYSSDGFWVPSSPLSHGADKTVEGDSTKSESQRKGESQAFRCGDTPKIHFYPQPSNILGLHILLGTRSISLRDTFVHK